MGKQRRKLNLEDLITEIKKEIEGDLKVLEKIEEKIEDKHLNQIDEILLNK